MPKTSSKRSFIFSLVTTLLLISEATPASSTILPIQTHTLHLVFLNSPAEKYQWTSELKSSSQHVLLSSGAWWKRVSNSKYNFKLGKIAEVSANAKFSRCNPELDYQDAQLAIKVTKLQKYEHLVVLNNASTCNYSGIGKLSGSTVLITKKGLIDPYVNYLDNGLPDIFTKFYEENLTTLLVHEIGHNLGFLHAASFSCPNLNFDKNISACVLNSYGDAEDVMGSGVTKCDHLSTDGLFGNMSLANRQPFGQVKVVPIKKAGKYGLTFDALAPTHTVYSLSTKLGTAFLEFHPYAASASCQADKGEVELGGLEIRYAGSAVAKGTKRVLGIQGDTPAIGFVALNNNPQTSSLFIKNQNRFFPGDGLRLPGTSFALRVLSVSETSIKFKLINQSATALDNRDESLVPTISTLPSDSRSFTVAWEPAPYAVQYLVYGRSGTNFEQPLFSVNSVEAALTKVISYDEWFTDIAVVAVDAEGRTTKKSYISLG